MTDTQPAPVSPTGPSSYRPPPGACDSHAHVFGPPDRFPLAPDAAYLPPAAPVEAYLAHLDALGVACGVLVQPAPYGQDNAALVDALRRHPARLRGVALAGSRIGDAVLEQLGQAGVKGLRFTHFPEASGQHVAGIGLAELTHLAPRLRACGMHAQLWMHCADFVEQAPALLGLGVPLVLDHMARVHPEHGTDEPSFCALLGLLANEDIWVKLVPHRASTQYPDYHDIVPFQAAMVGVRPDRLLWGTDWPYVRMGSKAPDGGHLLDLFAAGVPDAGTRQAILVDNPARLYGFPR